MDANSKIVWEKQTYRWVSLCEDLIKTWPDCSKFTLQRCSLDWSPNRTAHKGGWYSSGPGINLSMWLLSRDRGDIFRIYEYRSFDEDRIIGGFYTTDANLATGMIVCHEMAHAVQFFRMKELNKQIDRPHGESFKTPYRILRKTLLNPLLPDQKEMRDRYNLYVKKLVGL